MCVVDVFFFQNVSFTKHCLYPPGSRCLVFLRKGGFTPETKNKVIAGTIGKKGQTRKLKVVTVDTGKYQVRRAVCKKTAQASTSPVLASVPRSTTVSAVLEMCTVLPALVSM